MESRGKRFWGWLTTLARHGELLERLEWYRNSNDIFVQQAFALKKELRARDAELERIEESYAVAGLSPGEIERLAIVAEECGEVARAVGKVLRFGWESQSPYSGRTNRAALEREIGSVRAIVNLMIDAGDLQLNNVQAWQRSKRGALAKWTQYQECSVSREEQLRLLRTIAEKAGD